MEPGEVYVTPHLAPRYPGAVVVDERALAAASYRSESEGILAVFEQRPAPLPSLISTADPIVLVVESVEKPGNLGAMLRTADAAGADAVIVCDPTIDVFNPNVLRSSTGACFTVPLAVTTVGDALDWLAANEIPAAAATPDARMSLWKAPLDPPIAIVVGSEAGGLSNRALHGSSFGVAIPMAGTVDSLNVSVATAVLLYEAARRRSHHPPTR